MKVKITPTGESAQVMEFNVSLPCGANASIAPVSTLTVTQRWAKVVNVSTTERSTYKLLNLMLFTISNTLIVKEM